MQCKYCVYNEREYDCVPCEDSYGQCLNFVEFMPVPDEFEDLVSE